MTICCWYILHLNAWLSRQLLQCDGNLFDAISIAIKAALFNTRWVTVPFPSELSGFHQEMLQLGVILLLFIYYFELAFICIFSVVIWNLVYVLVIVLWWLKFTGWMLWKPWMSYEKLKHIPFPKQNSQSAHIWGWGGREGDRAVRRPIRLHAAQCGECAMYRNPVQGTAKPGTLPTMHHSPRVILGVFSFNGVSAARAIRDEITLAALWCHALVSLCSAASSRTHLFSYVFM